MLMPPQISGPKGGASKTNDSAWGLGHRRFGRLTAAFLRKGFRLVGRMQSAVAGRKIGSVQEPINRTSMTEPGALGCVCGLAFMRMYSTTSLASSRSLRLTGTS